MKNIYKLLTLVFLYFLQYNCYSQQLVLKTSDVHKLAENKEQFINQPLKKLLNEIKPEIKTANPLNSELSFVFGFRWTTLTQQRKREGSITDRVTLLVYVKQFIQWNWNERPIGNEIAWTQQDSYKYGDLTVIDIEVILPKD
ncbi:hypothetical protein [Flavobacterium gelatinilyticum]|uniref:hypothetical protein n=1 Tax=Flavobacterium gelatinilyticum TaxID=3003260 RepID=UPI00247FDA57|nr:hypothetical protein [Flavobacterium gelatinilyticum]